jgi:hypothetical protein
MSYQDLEEAFEHPKLTIPKLQRFRKEQLERFCEANSIKVQQKGVKKPLKAAYVAALFNAVCNCYDSWDTYSLASFQRPAAAENKANSRRPKMYFQLYPR